MVYLMSCLLNWKSDKPLTLSKYHYVIEHSTFTIRFPPLDIIIWRSLSGTIYPKEFRRILPLVSDRERLSNAMDHGYPPYRPASERSHPQWAEKKREACQCLQSLARRWYDRRLQKTISKDTMAFWGTIFDNDVGVSLALLGVVSRWISFIQES